MEIIKTTTTAPMSKNQYLIYLIEELRPLISQFDLSDEKVRELNKQLSEIYYQVWSNQ